MKVDVLIAKNGCDRENLIVESSDLAADEVCWYGTKVLRYSSQAFTCLVFTQNRNTCGSGTYWKIVSWTPYWMFSLYQGLRTAILPRCLMRVIQMWWEDITCSLITKFPKRPQPSVLPLMLKPSHEKMFPLGSPSYLNGRRTNASALSKLWADQVRT